MVSLNPSSTTWWDPVSKQMGGGSGIWIGGKEGPWVQYSVMQLKKKKDNLGYQSGEERK